MGRWQVAFINAAEGNIDNGQRERHQQATNGNGHDLRVLHRPLGQAVPPRVFQSARGALGATDRPLVDVVPQHAK